MRLADIWKGLVAQTNPEGSGIPADHLEQQISQVVVDSRRAEPGTLFVALQGERTDGNLYLQDACAQGAFAAIVEPRARAGMRATYIEPDGALCAGTEDGTPAPPYVFVVPDSLDALQRLAAYWRSQLPVQIIAITGSVGKTTTKETVAKVLGQAFMTLHSEGNLNNEIGLPLTLFRLTPDHQRAVVEMGMYARGEIAALCQLARPRIGIVTNVGPTHLERLGTIERIAAAKAELVQALPPATEGGVAILNGDDEHVKAMAALTRARVFTYGLDPASDLWADEISSEGMEGIRFRFHHGSAVLHVQLPMLGRHSVHTALRAAAVGLAEGLSWAEIITGLQDVTGQLRLMVVPGLRETTIIDDTYNASPASMLAALNLLEDLSNHMHRPVAVLGDMLELGSYEEEGHRLVGGRAAQVAQKLVTVGRRARWIAEEAVAAGMSQADVYPTDSNEDALAVLQGLIRPDDIILVKGSRGQAMESIVDELSRSRV